MDQLENLKLYKPNLAALLEDSWVDAMNVVKTVAIKLDKRTQRLLQEQQQKINQLLNINRQLETEQQKWI